MGKYYPNLKTNGSWLQVLLAVSAGNGTEEFAAEEQRYLLSTATRMLLQKRWKTTLRYPVQTLRCQQ